MTSRQASMPNSSNIERVELENGIVILVYENPDVQSVNVMGSIHAGSVYEPNGKSGLASFVAGALMTGTSCRDFDSIHSALEDIGAELSLRGHMHRVGFSGKALAEDLSTLIDVANDALRNPVFPAEHVERLRGERLTWLQYSQFDTRYRASKAMREALYPADHSYHYGTYGSEDTISGIGPEDLRGFHCRQYGPRGMIVVIVGAVKGIEAVDMVSSALGDWHRDDQPVVKVVDTPSTCDREDWQTVTVPGKTQSDISMGIVGPARTADDFVAAQLANSVLGEFGMMGRIGKSVREEKGLAYYASSRLSGGHGPEPWTVSAGVNPENIDLAIESILAEIERLTSEYVTADDLADNQSYFTGRMPLRLESNEGIAAHIHSMESFGLGLNYLLDYEDMIANISRKDLLAAAKRYLSARGMVIAVAGPELAGS